MSEKSKKEVVAELSPKKQSELHIKTGYLGKDSRQGRLHDVDTDRGAFRFKDNRKGD